MDNSRRKEEQAILALFSYKEKEHEELLETIYKSRETPIFDCEDLLGVFERWCDYVSQNSQYPTRDEFDSFAPDCAGLVEACVSEENFIDETGHFDEETRKRVQAHGNGPMVWGEFRKLIQRASEDALNKERLEHLAALEKLETANNDIFGKPWNISDLQECNLTDDSVTLLMYKHFGDVFIWVIDLKQYFSWNGKKYDIMGDGLLSLAARETARVLYSYWLEQKSDDPEKQKIIRAMQREAKGRCQGPRLNYCKTFYGDHSRANLKDFNSNKYLFNCQNGVLDVKHKVLLPHDKQFRITKLSNFIYVKDAKCPNIDAHYRKVLGHYDDDGNWHPCEELIRYWITIQGNTLILEAPERLLVLLLGETHTGKTQTIELLKHGLGEYAVKVSQATWAATKTGHGPNESRARMQGATFAWCDELSEETHMDINFVKDSTGGGDYVGRVLFGHETQTQATACPAIISNHKPVILNGDDAIWNRLCPIMFNAKISDEDKHPDYGQTLFDEENSGFLNLLLEGAERYINEELT